MKYHWVAAALPILVMWLLWRVQAIAVDKGLRRALYRLLRYQKHAYNVVSWFGVLLHELSHALFLLLGGHGIRNFKVRTDSGHVTPSQIRRGPIGQLTFLAAALAPLYVTPAILVAVGWFLLLPPESVNPGVAEWGLPVVWGTLLDTWTSVVNGVWFAMVGLDVTTWAGAVFLALMVFALPAARPSFSKGREGEKDKGDIAVVRRKIRKNPWPVLVLSALLYASYFAAAHWSWRGYWIFWQFAWAISITCIVLALLAAIGWWGVAWTGRIRPAVAWIPYAWVIVAQVAGRYLGYEMWVINVASLLGFALLAAGWRAVMPRRW